MWIAEEKRGGGRGGPAEVCYGMVQYHTIVSSEFESRDQEYFFV